MHDKLSKQTRLLAHWSEPRRVLHCSIDQGTTGWPANYFLYFSQDLRGWMIMDPSHRRHNNVHDALRDSSLAHLKHEMTICVNLGSAPWSSCGHFFRYREAAEEYSTNPTESDSLCVEVYPFLVHDLWGGQPQAEFGSAGHMKLVFDVARQAPIFFGKGDKTQLNRWLQFTIRWRQFETWASVLLPIIVHVGINLSWWTCLENSPLGLGLEGLPGSGFNIRGQDEAGEELRQAAAQGDDEAGEKLRQAAGRPKAATGGGRGAKGSGDIAEKLIGIKSSLYVVGDISASRVHRAMFIAIAAISQPVELEHARTIGEHRTRSGALGPCSGGGRWPAATSSTSTRSWPSSMTPACC